MTASMSAGLLQACRTDRTVLFNEMLLPTARGNVRQAVAVQRTSSVQPHSV